MPSDRAYQYSQIDVYQVMKNPLEYIIPENLEACKLLWSKNIFTKMCNNYDNDFSWITIDVLSPENQEIFDSLAIIDDRFGSTWGGIGIKIPLVPEKGRDTFESFKELIDMFLIQDVQKDGYIDIQTFMTYYTDCYSLAYTPEYLELIKPMMSNDGDILFYSPELEKKMMVDGVRRTERIFDSSKMTKSIEEYIDDSKFNGFYDPDEGRIYYNEMYFEAHRRFKEQNKTPKL